MKEIMNWVVYVVNSHLSMLLYVFGLMMLIICIIILLSRANWGAIRNRVAPAVIDLAERLGIIWGLRVAAAILILIGTAVSTGLCLIALIFLIVHETSVSRMDRANRRVEDHNRTLGRRRRGRENGVGYWEALQFTCGANYYWLVPVVVICMLLITSA